MRKPMSLLSLLAVGTVALLAHSAVAQAPQDSTRMKPVPTRPGPQPVPVPGQKPGQHKPGEYPYGNLGSPSSRARAEMRQVWGEHVAFTRNYIVSAVAGLPDANDVSNRLLQNADEIGRVFQPYYGDNGARQLSTLMRDHVKILTELTQVVSGDATGTRVSVNATRDMSNVDKEAMSGIQQRLEANARQIAAFLNRSNPNFKLSDFEGMMQSHVDHLIDQIDARLNGDWQADIQAFDLDMDHVFTFSDALSEGIERQFPNRFAQAKS